VHILVNGQPGKAVAGLFRMRLDITLATYNVLVRLAPVRPRRPTSSQRAQPVGP
jgi:hypothetical protein